MIPAKLLVRLGLGVRGAEPPSLGAKRLRVRVRAIRVSVEYETGVRGRSPPGVSVPNDLAQTVLPVLVGPQRIRLLRLCPPPLSPIVAWLFHSAILGQ